MTNDKKRQKPWEQRNYEGIHRSPEARTVSNWGLTSMKVSQSLRVV